MKLICARSSRPKLEFLEERTVPTLSSTSLLADASGNFAATLVASNPTLNIAYDGATATLSLDDGGTPLVISGVTGNVTINARTTAAATSVFLTNASFADTFAGNFTLSTSRALTGTNADANIQLVTTAAATILGNVRLTTNTPAESICSIIPAATFPLTIAGSISITTNGSGTGINTNKVVNFSPQAALTIGGGLFASNTNVFSCNAGSAPMTINGSTVIQTRASATSPNIVQLFSLATTDLVFQRLQIALGNSGNVSKGVVIQNATINELLTISLGNHSGATSSFINLVGLQVNGSLVSITGGTGNKFILFSDVSAPLARLTVSLGNAASNLVVFAGSNNAFLYTTLVGGTGTNTVIGTIPSPFKLIRFSF